MKNFDEKDIVELPSELSSTPEAINEIKNKKLEKLEFEKKSAKIKYWMTIILLFAEIIIILGIISFPQIKEAIHTKKNEVAVINISKPITTEYVHTIMDKISEELKNKHTKEFLILVNSPGGSPTASEELSEYLKYVKQKKPVHMYIESIAASGAYYIASAIKPLYANKNAIVGSIGVIIPHYSLEELSKKVGVKDDYVAIGKYKKPISLLKDVSEEDRKYLETHLLYPAYRNFLKDVADNRGVPVKTMERFAEGKIFIANDEKIKGVLVDKIENLYVLKQRIKDKYPDEEFRFKKIQLEKEKNLPFQVKLDIGLEEAINALKHQF